MRDPRVLLGQVTLEVCLGAELFFRETFEGNGRTCGSCHPAQNNYTIDSTYISRLPATDPLFVAEYDSALADLEKPMLLRNFGMVLVNAEGFADPVNSYVVRSVSHMLGLATSITAPPWLENSTTHAADGTLLPPMARLGWGGDGSPGRGELRDFADGAIEQHMTRSLARRVGIDFVLPDDDERDAMAAFSGTLGRMNEVDITKVALSDAAAERGRASFLGGAAAECGIRCHINAGANTFNTNAQNEIISGLANFSFDIGTAFVRLPAVDALRVPLDGGHGRRPLDRDGDGIPDDVDGRGLRYGNGAMNVTSLIEAADTEPMFHTNASATIEDAIQFYATDAFARSFVSELGWGNVRAPGTPMALTATDVAEVGRFLRVINAALNTQMARYRVRAAIEIADHFHDAHHAVERGLLELASAEIHDALEVLGAVDELNRGEQASFHWADSILQYIRARRTMRSPERAQLMQLALRKIEHGERGLGTGMEMELGSGTLMF